MRICFSYDDSAAFVHVAEWPPKHEQTLCGKRAFFTSLTRRRITCPVCVKRNRPAPDFDPHIDYPERFSDGRPI